MPLTIAAAFPVAVALTPVMLVRAAMDEVPAQAWDPPG